MQVQRAVGKTLCLEPDVQRMGWERKVVKATRCLGLGKGFEVGNCCFAQGMMSLGAGLGQLWGSSSKAAARMDPELSAEGFSV